MVQPSYVVRTLVCMTWAPGVIEFPLHAGVTTTMLLGILVLPRFIRS